jgi:hypothetical protein
MSRTQSHLALTRIFVRGAGASGLDFGFQPLIKLARWNFELGGVSEARRKGERISVHAVTVSTLRAGHHRPKDEALRIAGEFVR